MAKNTGTEPDTRTADEILEDAKAEAQLILEDAKAKATETVKAANETAKGIVKGNEKPLKANPSYQMKEDGYTKHDLVKVKALEGAKHHAKGEEFECHGVQAEPLIRKGYAEFVEVVTRSSEKNKYAVKPPPAKK